MITEETVNRIIRLDGDGLPIVSLYARVPFDPGAHAALHTRVDSLLRDIRPVAEDKSMDREIRLSVRGDVERIEERARGQEDCGPAESPSSRAPAVASTRRSNCRARSATGSCWTHARGCGPCSRCSTSTNGCAW
jgi:hypothetical protein